MVALGGWAFAEEQVFSVSILVRSAVSMWCLSLSGGFVCVRAGLCVLVCACRFVCMCVCVFAPGVPVRVQGYLAHKKQRPPPRTIIEP